MNNTSTSEKVHAQFVGRQEDLDAFYLRFAYRHMKNGIYYCGGGGLGKTWILWKIIGDNQGDPIRVVMPIIDFFDTQNHSVRGLQATIKSHLQAPEAFKPYDKALKRLEEARSKPGTHPSAIASLEARADRVFIQCCQDAIVGREVILLFDTFERVQQRYVGRWLRQEFLPQVGDLIVAIAGRPEPAPAQMPDNVVTYKLKGLAPEAFADLVRRRLPSASDKMVESIRKHINGVPLMTNLILDLHEPERGQFIARLSQLGEDERVQDSPELQRWLVGQFVDPLDKINKMIWAMTYLRRRFDVLLLKYIVENTGWFQPDDYETIFNDLRQLIYVKEYPHQQSHLLHDEIQRMVAEYVLPEVGIWEELCAILYDSVVNRYYPETVKAIEEVPPDKKTLADVGLARQLRAEQLGYTLDQDPAAGLEKYKSYRVEVEKKTHDYDFEELLWGEVRDHLDGLEDMGYRVCSDRGQWLHRHSLFHKAERHYRYMVGIFEKHSIETRQSLGFMLLRQGKLAEAERTFQESCSLVQDDDFENIATIENTLGQVARRAGRWKEALKHYAQSFSAAVRIHDPHMISAYLNRGELYALQGSYKQAREQCEQAISWLESLSRNRRNLQRNIYAHRNLGTAHRYSGDYALAAHYYETSSRLAEESNDLEATCNVSQHIGINEYLWGRTFRRDLLEQTLPQHQEALNEACEHQLKAWQNLTKSLEMARESDWRDMIDDGFHRLGKVYREIYRIQNLLPQLGEDIGIPDTWNELQRLAASYQIPLEVEYEHQLLTRGAFEQLDWIERAIRLFDLGALVADEVNDIHRALDSLTELARTFVELGMKEQVLIVLRRVERLKGYDYQELLFAAMNDIIRGDLDFIEGRLDAALDRYAKAYADVAEQSGYASFLLTDRLRDLEWRLRELPHETALRWCDVLENEWQDRLPSDKWPDMLGTLEHVRAEIWAYEAAAQDK